MLIKYNNFLLNIITDKIWKNICIRFSLKNNEYFKNCFIMITAREIIFFYMLNEKKFMLRYNFKENKIFTKGVEYNTIGKNLKNYKKLLRKIFNNF